MVSILICTYNSERFLRETLDSVLNQNYADFELLIFDDKSSDATLSILEEYRDRDSRIKLFIGTGRKGPYEGLNFLLERAKGKYIAINDHDDIWHREKLEKQISYLEKNKEYVGCGSGILNWYEKHDAVFYRSQPRTSKVAWHTTLVFRNEGFRYDTSVEVATDFHFMRNILCANGHMLYNFEEPYVLRRIFAGSSNLSGKWMRKMSVMDILELKIGIIDRIALLTRKLSPQEAIERFVVAINKNNIPSRFLGMKRELELMA